MGGRQKWIDEGRTLVTDVPNYDSTGYQAKFPDDNVRATADTVRDTLGQGVVNLVDVRSPAEFSGEVIAPPGMSETAQRGGHIPDAANIPWATAVAEDGTFKSRDELQAIYGGEGVDDSKETIAYCRIGERSSHTWFVLKYLLGYEKGPQLRWQLDGMGQSCWRAHCTRLKEELSAFGVLRSENYP